MDINSVIGIVVVFAALCLMVVLVLHGRRTIHRIARNGGGASARQIVKDGKDE